MIDTKYIGKCKTCLFWARPYSDPVLNPWEFVDRLVKEIITTPEDGCEDHKPAREERVEN